MLRTMNRNCLSVLLLACMLCGCSPSTTTFAGFTFGGGGHTFSAEPAELELGDTTSTLRAGLPDQDVHLLLEWPSQAKTFQGDPIKLNSAKVKVLSRGESDRLTEGEIVLQARQKEIGHGSFDFKVKLEDGREFRVVGSFTAKIQEIPPQE